MTDRTLRATRHKRRFGPHVKKRAIYAHLESFYSKYPGQSWKNVLSLGDSEFEREATLQSTKAWQLSAHHNGIDPSIRVRTKVVKMLEDPTDEELFAQLQLICGWLPSMVAINQCFDINLELTNATMYELNDLLQVCGPVNGTVNDEDFLRTGHIPIDDVFGSAIHSDVLWKLSLGRNKTNPESYLRRICWLSKNGRLWYDSRSQSRSMLYVPSQISNTRYRLSEDEGELTMSGTKVYLFAIISIEPPYTEYVFGCDGLQQRTTWMDHFQAWMS